MLFASRILAASVALRTPPHPFTVRSGLAVCAEGDDNAVPLSELKEPAHNVIGTALRCCCADVRGTGIGTGFYRDGFCSTGATDEGRHTVCIEATEKFLAFSAAVGNPLHEAIPQYMFPGVKPGDQWCLCAARYAQAVQACSCVLDH